MNDQVQAQVAYEREVERSQLPRWQRFRRSSVFFYLQCFSIVAVCALLAFSVIATLTNADQQRKQAARFHQEDLSHQKSDSTHRFDSCDSAAVVFGTIIKGLEDLNPNGRLDPLIVILNKEEKNRDTKCRDAAAGAAPAGSPPTTNPHT